MTDEKRCVFCLNAHPNREKDGKIRCIRTSGWVDPNASCHRFEYRNVFHVVGGIHGKNH